MKAELKKIRICLHNYQIEVTVDESECERFKGWFNVKNKELFNSQNNEAYTIYGTVTDKETSEAKEIAVTRSNIEYVEYL